MEKVTANKALHLTTIPWKLTTKLHKDEIRIEGEQDRVSSQKYAHLKEIVEVKTETNPWIKCAGMFVEDPYFDEFLIGIEAIRKKIDDEGYDGTTYPWQLRLTASSVRR